MGPVTLALPERKAAMRIPWIGPRIIILAVCLAALGFTGSLTGAEPRSALGIPKLANDANDQGRLEVHLSWGHQSPPGSAFSITLGTEDAHALNVVGQGLEGGDVLQGNVLQTRSGGGDVDGVVFTLRFPDRTVTPITNLHTIWGQLLASSDADTARRLRLDPGYRPDRRQLTVQMGREGTKGFTVTVDQMLTNKVFWVPALDVFLSAGDSPPSFPEHQKNLADWSGRRVLDQVRREPEASYEQFAAKWEDMGGARYRNPAERPPGHIVCVTWDSALYKFGIDRGAGVRSDLGNPDQFQFSFDFGEHAPDLVASWKGQRLTAGLPVINTSLETGGVRYEVEQFAHPLNGPPPERRGDIPMVLLQKVKVSELEGKAGRVPIRMTLQREPGATGGEVSVQSRGDVLICEETSARGVVLALQGTDLMLLSDRMEGTKPKILALTVAVSVPAGGSREFVIKLPSPLVPASERDRLLKLDYAPARAATLRYWADLLARGARFEVPEAKVNELFRANLWHALRLPRRHGGQDPNVTIDLPYSNFAYDQKGTPWPVNQAVYVDYMLYDLRGHHDVSADELAAIFRNNQEPDGRVGGYANWGVYTPSMIYAVAQHYLLTGDRADLDRLLPQTLKALDWCLAQTKQAERNSGAARGLVLAPLNDLTKVARAWAFNQAYLFAGLDLLSRVLTEIQHPRAEECRVAARAIREAVELRFSQASTSSPLVQLRDHSWIPYVPCDALTPRRLLDVWYPTDVDTGALHLSRLKALDPAGALTTYLLNDHEDNLFYRGWGMANEPVYNQHATAYLLRDDVKPAIRAFYSMMACAFSHSVFEPVEHRWAWGQFFGPPSTDGAWFELYRHMLIHERDDDTLSLLQATPRRWLEDGKRIEVVRAPTYYGLLTMIVDSRVSSGEIRVALEISARKRPGALVVRLRHPQGKAIKSVSVNGQSWVNFDTQGERVRIERPSQAKYDIVAHY
jgi:hypothetical protein